MVLKTHFCKVLNEIQLQTKPDAKHSERLNVAIEQSVFASEEDEGCAEEV